MKFKINSADDAIFACIIDIIHPFIFSFLQVTITSINWLCFVAYVFFGSLRFLTEKNNKKHQKFPVS